MGLWLAQDAQAAEILRGLIDRIVITTDKATGKPVVDLEGDLAGILSLCHTSKNAASVTEDDVSQISVVAGAGFEPAQSARGPSRPVLDIRPKIVPPERFTHGLIPRVTGSCART